MHLVLRTSNLVLNKKDPVARIFFLKLSVGNNLCKFLSVFQELGQPDIGQGMFQQTED